MTNVLDAAYAMANQIERKVLWAERMGTPVSGTNRHGLDKQTVARGVIHATMAVVPVWIVVALLTGSSLTG